MDTGKQKATDPTISQGLFCYLYDGHGVTMFMIVTRLFTQAAPEYSM